MYSLWDVKERRVCPGFIPSCRLPALQKDHFSESQRLLLPFHLFLWKKDCYLQRVSSLEKLSRGKPSPIAGSTEHLARNSVLKFSVLFCRLKRSGKWRYGLCSYPKCWMLTWTEMNFKTFWGSSIITQNDREMVCIWTCMHARLCANG